MYSANDPLLYLASHSPCSRVGILKELKNAGPSEGREVVVDFPEDPNWKGLFEELEKAPPEALKVLEPVLYTLYSGSERGQLSIGSTINTRFDKKQSFRLFRRNSRFDKKVSGSAWLVTEPEDGTIQLPRIAIAWI